MGMGFSKSEQEVGECIDEDVYTELIDGVDQDAYMRLKAYWDSHSHYFMTPTQCLQTVLPHPDVPIKELAKALFNDERYIRFNDFVNGISFLLGKNNELRNGFFCGAGLKDFIDFSFPTNTNLSQLLLETPYNILAQVTNFSETEIEEIDRVHRQLCTAGNQRISKSTFNSFIECFVPQPLLGGIFSAFDTNSDGFLDLSEFVCGLSVIGKGPEPERIQFFGKVLDTDRDGYIEHDDLAVFCKVFSVSDSKTLGLKKSEHIPIIEFTLWVDGEYLLRKRLLSIEDNIFFELMAQIRRETPPRTPPIAYDAFANHNYNYNVDAVVDKQKSKQHKVTHSGFLNLGNTCYINAALQSLANIPELNDLLLMASQENMDYDSPAQVTKAYLTLLEVISNQERSSYLYPSVGNPSHLKSLIQSLHPHLFDDFQHHDCSEFMNLLLDQLNTECRALYGMETAEGSGETSSQKELPSQPKIVADLFGGQLQSTLVCSHCKHSSSTNELFTSLQLPISIKQGMLVFVKVVYLRPSPPKQFGFRVSKMTTVSAFKKILSTATGIDVERMKILILDKSDQFDHRLTNRFEAVTLLSSLPLAGIELCCYEIEDSEKFVHIICVHRRFRQKAQHIVKDVDGIETIVFGYPTILSIQKTALKFLTAQTLYFDVMTKIEKLFSSKRLPDVNNANVKPNRALDADENSCSGYPFELALTLNDAKWCVKCHWKKFCRGCSLNPDETDHLQLDDDPSTYLLTVNWKSIAFYMRYGNLYNFETLFENDESVARSIADHHKVPSLADCIDEFVRPEHINDSTCEKCHWVSAQEKSLAITKLPKVLVISLKRFCYTESLGRFVKSSTPITFPLDELFLGTAAVQPQPQQNQGQGPVDGNETATSSEQAEQEMETKQQQWKETHHVYKCTAVVNHQGQLNHGHYTTYIRDFVSGDWVLYNDSHYKVVSAEEVSKCEEAYVLVYEKKESESVSRLENGNLSRMSESGNDESMDTGHSELENSMKDESNHTEHDRLLGEDTQQSPSGSGTSTRKRFNSFCLVTRF